MEAIKFNYSFNHPELGELGIVIYVAPIALSGISNAPEIAFLCMRKSQMKV